MQQKYVYYLRNYMGSLGKLLVLKLVAEKVVSIEDQETDKQTNRRTDRFRALLYRLQVEFLVEYSK